MLERIAAWLLTFLLDYLRKKATAEIGRILEERKEEIERGEVNEKNIREYAEAVTRAERIDRATDLLNRN